MKTPRVYQESAIQSLWDWLFQPDSGNPLLVMPVAAGKTLTMAEFIRRVHLEYPRTRILLLTHVKELLTQSGNELLSQYPGADFGYYCASLGQKKLYNDITLASIQSVHNKIDRFNRCPEIILIDEAHLISHKDSTQYRKFIDSVLAINPNCKIVGLTGTPFRTDTGRLDDGEGKLFDGIAYEISMKYMIEEGYWTKPFTPKIDYKMDISGVKMRGGDYISGQLEKAVDNNETTKACIDRTIDQAKDRKKVLVFTAGIQHCEHVRDYLRECGESAEMLTGDTPKDERARLILDYANGKFKYLVNVAVLTTGFDDPAIDCLVFMRPTRSPVLYIQTIGRGVRVMYANGYDLTTREGRLDAIANGVKPNCMVLDFGGVVSELGPIDEVEIRKTYTGEKEDSEKGEAVTKRCPSCGTLCAGAQRYCYECSYSFVSESLSDTASNKAVVSVDVEPEEYKIMGVEYNKHIKKNAPDSPPSLKVSYVTMAGVFHEWVCFEHHKYPEGNSKRFAWKKAQEWHRDREDLIDCPMSVEDAIAVGYNDPEYVIVKKEGKYDRVIGVKFEVNDEEEEFEEMEIPF